MADLQSDASWRNKFTPSQNLCDEARAVVLNADVILAALQEDTHSENSKRLIDKAKANTEAALAFLEDLQKVLAVS